jgi:hypothetical protein
MSKHPAANSALRRGLLLSAGVLVLISGRSLFASDTVVKKLASGLGSPWSIAVRPDGSSRGELYVGDRGGGRILRIVLDHPDVVEEVITGFPQAKVSKEKSATPGIESLYFLDHSRLIASGGDDMQPFVRLYELPDSSGALKFDDQKQSIEVAAENRQELETAGVRGFRSIARPRANDRVSDMLLLAGTSDEPQTGLWKIPLRANTMEDTAPFPFTKTNDKIHSVDAIAVASSGYVTVAVTVVRDSASHSMLKFIDPTDGRSRLDVPTDLEGIFGLAYNPLTGDLFAAGFEAGLTSSGVYRLDDGGEPGKPRGRAKKIAALRQATALAFSSDGTLFVTCVERPSDGDSDGALYKLSDF